MIGRIDALDDAYAMTCRFPITDDDHDSPDSHVDECSFFCPQERITDGCYSPPTHRGVIKLDDSTSGILTVLRVGIGIALPGMAFGVYRWYISQQLKVSDREQELYSTSGNGSRSEDREETGHLVD